MSWRVSNILQLREPPELGRNYRVPCIHGKFYGRLEWWPVLLPSHSDGNFFPGFPWHHYHVDHRFLTVRQLRSLSTWGMSARKTTARSPIIVRGPGLPDVDPDHAFVESSQRPTLRKLRCQLDSPSYPFRTKEEVRRLRAAYGEGNAGAPCIRTRSGRTLCPHQRVDLSSYPVGTDGTVICPAHGLKVRVAA